MTVRLVLSLLFCVCVAACGGSDDEAGGDPASGASADSHTSHGGSKHACDILTVDFVKESLGIDELIPNEEPKSPTPGGRVRTYSSCSFTWPSDKMRTMEVAGREIEFKDENSVTLSISIFEPGQDKSAYDTGVKYLTERNEHEALSGVGDEAIWFPKMGQISARGNGNVIHLTLKHPDGEGEPLEYTKAMALKVLEQLK
jgi:hypothetical protein